MTDQPHLSQFNATDKGANLTFVGYSVNDVGNILRDFFMFAGFTMESGTPMSGLFTTGSAGGRALLGGLANRKKYSVNVWADATYTYAQVESTMSGASGSVLGLVRERKGRDEIKGQLHMFMQQFAKK
jgi:hypothetical protein